MELEFTILEFHLKKNYLEFQVKKRKEKKLQGNSSSTFVVVVVVVVVVVFFFFFFNPRQMIPRVNRVCEIRFWVETNLGSQNSLTY